MLAVIQDQRLLLILRRLRSLLLLFQKLKSATANHGRLRLRLRRLRRRLISRPIVDFQTFQFEFNWHWQKLRSHVIPAGISQLLSGIRWQKEGFALGSFNFLIGRMLLLDFHLLKNATMFQQIAHFNLLRFWHLLLVTVDPLCMHCNLFFAFLMMI